ncbi:uncharacterized protein LOC106157845 isoform X3 [Lingula anatina]|uniref:Uncharacterized protein LOC106157845 isoform X3 n=1 Tax=Lingula anatina TaxID=7574 RepID=A0A1S3HU56_LINAN|nr:uncharacterized protein LOC106157845 isoform X3 [Lingula anatina]|eukprot:XP_013389071.1 uncharacterized protein LOC106157845 isoform X3 [Lingula anatina]
MVYFSHYRPDDYSRVESDFLAHSANRAVFLAEDALGEQDDVVNRSKIKDDRLLRDINHRMAAASPKVQFSSHSYRSRSVGRAPSVPPMGVSYRASSVARRRAKSVEPIPISVDYSLRAHRRPMQDSLITDRLYLDRAYAAASGIADSTRGLDWDTGRHSILSPSFTPYGVSSYYSSVSRSRRASSVPPLPVYSSLYSRSVRRGGGEDKEQEYVYPGSHYPSFRSLVGHVSPYRSYSSYGLGQSGDRLSYSYGRSHPVPSGTTRIKVDLSGRGGEPDVRFYQHMPSIISSPWAKVLKISDVSDRPWRHSLVTSAPKRSPLHIEKRLLTMTEPDFPPPSHFRHLRTMLGELHNTMDKERMLIDRYLKEDLGPETTSQKTMKSVSSSSRTMS